MEHEPVQKKELKLETSESKYVKGKYQFQIYWCTQFLRDTIAFVSQCSFDIMSKRTKWVFTERNFHCNVL